MRKFGWSEEERRRRANPKTQQPTVDAAFSRISSAIKGLEVVSDDPEMMKQIREMEDQLKGVLPTLKASAQQLAETARDYEWVIEDDGLPYVHTKPAQAKVAIEHLQKKFDFNTRGSRFSGTVGDAKVLVENDRITVNDLSIWTEGGRLYVEGTDVTDLVNRKYEKVGGYRDHAAPALPVPARVKTTWFSRLLRKFLAWLEKEVP